MADFTEQNRQFFDKLAHEYQERFGKVKKQLADLVQSRRLWISDKWTDTEAGKGRELRMLEYACGPGAISIALAPYLTKVVGVDVAENMVAHFNKNAQDAGLSDKMAGYTGDLLAESAPAKFSSSEFSDFDLVVVSMALHHFDDAESALKRLGDRLKKDGVCFIIDLIPQEHGHHHHHHHHHGGNEGSKDPFAEASHTIRKNGFSSEEMKSLFESANLRANFDYNVVEPPLQFEKDGKTFQKTIFVARAQRV